MPLLALILLVALIATFGFGETLQALLGAVGFILLLVLILAALIAAGGTWLYRRAKNQVTRR
ncbi:hypothetical protein [Telmatospirillum sp. J64-1]|uniref:hypothetical protein n=1 Tax=Telmatospirillum sp. J64-1 TaxID=2502183 RepID=UPI00115CD931|nr:hypothetical protein [Telmatospirillum sp. J64-1]